MKLLNSSTTARRIERVFELWRPVRAYTGGFRLAGRRAQSGRDTDRLSSGMYHVDGPRNTIFVRFTRNLQAVIAHAMQINFDGYNKITSETTMKKIDTRVRCRNRRYG